jgi:hypothetical protein
VALFSRSVGKDTVSRIWRKVKSDWEVWNARSPAEEADRAPDPATTAADQLRAQWMRLPAVRFGSQQPRRADPANISAVTCRFFAPAPSFHVLCEVALSLQNRDRPAMYRAVCGSFVSAAITGQGFRNAVARLSACSVALCNTAAGQLKPRPVP